MQVGADPVYVTRYLERHAGRNELAARSASLPVGSVVTDGSLMRKEDFHRTAFYDECLRPQGLSSLVNLRAARGERGAVANVCVLRSAREGEFGAEEVELLSRLAPHLRRAVAVHARLAEAEGDRRALAGALERLPRRYGDPNFEREYARVGAGLDRWLRRDLPAAREALTDAFRTMLGVGRWRH